MKPIVLENEAICLQIHPLTGAWTGLVDKIRNEQLVIQAIDNIPAGLGFSSPPEVKLLSHRLECSKYLLEMRLLAGSWIVHVELKLLDDEPIILRSFTLENAGDRSYVLRGAGYVLPVFSLGHDMVAIRPDTKRVGNLPLEKISRPDPSPAPKDGLFYLWSAQLRRGIGMWFHSEEEFVALSAARVADGAQVTHNQEVAVEIKPHEKVRLGTQYVWLAGGSRDELLCSVHRIFEHIGLRTPSDGLTNLAECVLYCGHPGGTPEQRFFGYGGFRAIQRYVPTLHRMGVNLLWLLPFFEHGDGKKWNLYSPFDHFKISSLYGTVDELKSMLDACKEAGIQVIFDFVPHGPPDESELGRNHLDWVCLDEAGKPIYVWSQLAFDNANPGWQEYMRKAAEYNAREYGIVGARIDVATGSPPNWRSGTGYRPSFSTLGGGLGMCRAIREGLRRVHRNVVILPEEYTASRIYYRVADLTYDASLFLVLIDLQIRQATPTEWAETLQCFLHDQSLTLPRGALKMRWIANHDTVSWTIKKERPRKTFGFERARALIGLCCLIDGVPMIYQGEEDPSIYGGTGPSIVDYLAKLLNCRKRLPSLTSRVTDYQSVQATNGVFTCVRGSGRERTIVMVSLNPENVNSSLQLPSDLQDMSWKDELTGERINPSNVSMDGHQIRILVSAG